MQLTPSLLVNWKRHVLDTSLLVQDLQQRVYSNELFNKSIPNLYPLESRAQGILQEEYDSVKLVIDRIVDIVADVIHLDNNQKELFKLKAASEIMPLSLGMAGRVIHDYNIPNHDKILPAQVAALICIIDALIDKGFVQSEMIESLIHATRPLIKRSIPTHPALSFDHLFTEGRFSLPTEELLRKTVIYQTIVLPTVLEKRKLGSNYHQLWAKIKMNGSGFDASVWTCLAILEKNGIIESSQNVMQNPLFDQISKLGSVIARVADDIGDIEHDNSHGLINVLNTQTRQLFIEEFCRSSGLDPKLAPLKGSNQSEIEYNFELLHFFIDNIKLKIDEALKTVKSTDEMQVIIILARTVIVCYENFIGDVKMTVQNQSSLLQ